MCEEPLLTVDRQMGLNIVHPDGKVCFQKYGSVAQIIHPLCDSLQRRFSLGYITMRTLIQVFCIVSFVLFLR